MPIKFLYYKYFQYHLDFFQVTFMINLTQWQHFSNFESATCRICLVTPVTPRTLIDSYERVCFLDGDGRYTAAEVMDSLSASAFEIFNYNSGKTKRTPRSSTSAPLPPLSPLVVFPPLTGLMSFDADTVRSAKYYTRDLVQFSVMMYFLHILNVKVRYDVDSNITSQLHN